MLIVAALALLGLSVLWYVGLGRLRATQWTRPSGEMIRPVESQPASPPAGPPPAPYAPGPEGVAPSVSRGLDLAPAAPPPPSGAAPFNSEEFDFPPFSFEDRTRDAPVTAEGGPGSFGRRASDRAAFPFDEESESRDYSWQLPSRPPAMPPPPEEEAPEPPGESIFAKARQRKEALEAATRNAPIPTPEPAAPRGLEPAPAAPPAPEPEVYTPPPTIPLGPLPSPVGSPSSPVPAPPVAPPVAAPPAYGTSAPAARPAPVAAQPSAPGRPGGAAPTRPRQRGPDLRLPNLSRLFAGRRDLAADPEALLADQAAAPPVVPNVAFPVLIDREFRVDYTRRVYINQACYVIVRVGPAGSDLAPLTPAEAQTLVATPSQRLRFAAQEEEPRVEVALEFAEGTFYAARTTAQGVLHRDRETRFVFVVKPLKAEDCVLNIIVSYVEATGEAEQVARKVVIERTIRTADGQERQEHEAQTTYTPAAPVTHLRPVLTTERVIGVKSFLRLNTGELGLVQKGAGVVLTGTLLVAGAQNGQPFDPLYLLLSVAPLLGVPLGEATQKLLDRSGN